MAGEERKLSICQSVVCFEKRQNWELARSDIGSFSFFSALIRMLVLFYMVVGPAYPQH